MSDAPRNPWLHRIALLTAAATFPLIFMGGLVTSHGAGMSVPDWPNSYGYNMFLFPPRLWVGGILYEHTHRLMGTVVGMLSIALTVCAWATERRRWVRWLAAAVLAAVILQGVLGGLRVVMVELDLAIVHACFAQAFFCLAALAAVVTSRRWAEADAAPAPAARPIAVWAWVLVACVYGQLVAGALMRHYDAGLAMAGLLDLPPATAEGVERVNDLRVYTLGLRPVTLGQAWLHFAHRLGAVVVAAAAVVLIVKTLRRNHAGLKPLGVLLAFLLLAQLALGVFTVMYRKPADVASAHVAVGALVLVTAFVTAVRATRLSSLGIRHSDLIRHSGIRHSSFPRSGLPSPQPSPRSTGERECASDYVFQ